MVSTLLDAKLDCRCASERQVGPHQHALGTDEIYSTSPTHTRREASYNANPRARSSRSRFDTQALSGYAPPVDGVKLRGPTNSVTTDIGFLLAVRLSPLRVPRTFASNAASSAPGPLSTPLTPNAVTSWSYPASATHRYATPWARRAAALNASVSPFSTSRPGCPGQVVPSRSRLAGPDPRW